MLKKISNYILNFFYEKGYKIEKVALKKKIYKGKSKYENLSFHPTPIGNYYVIKQNKKDIVAYNMKRGCFYDENVIKTAKKFIKPGTIVLDVGSNYGQMTIEFSKFVGEQGLVYSFEAQKQVYDILKLNIEANQRNNIKLFYNAVYNENHKILKFPVPDLDIYSSYGSYGVNPKSKEGVDVESITIDSIEFPLPVSFIKVDIQGSDLFALQGGKQTILKNKMPIIFEFEQDFQEKFGTKFQDYIDFIAEINYEVVEVIEPLNLLILPK